MFVLYHTGPTIDAVSGDDKCALSRVLLQRTFIRDLLLSRLAVSTLNQIRFVDSKVCHPYYSDVLSEVDTILDIVLRL